MGRTENIPPEVSVAMCTYNGERFLSEQLNSILNQDYSNITEIVCVDDNSTDGTWKILQEYASKNKIFKIYQNKLNLGFNKNFEKAIKLTSKQYIAISDQDDIWYSSKISKLVDAIKKKLMSYSDNEYVDEDGKPIGKKFSDFRNLRTCTSCLNFVLYNGVSGHTVLINRNLLNYALPFSAIIPFDYWLAFQASQYGIIPYVNEALVGYRQHVNNVFGAIGIRKNKPENPREVSYRRILNFSQNINENLPNEKQILQQLAKTYIDLSFKSRLSRVVLFWENKDALLFFKKRKKLRKAFYCIKMFWQIR